MPDVTLEMVLPIVESIVVRRGDVLEHEQIEIAVVEALQGKEPPALDEKRGAPFDWAETIKLIFAAANFTKTCFELYAIYKDKNEARSRAKEIASKRGLTDEVSDVICDGVEKGGFA